MVLIGNDKPSACISMKMADFSDEKVEFDGQRHTHYKPSVWHCARWVCKNNYAYGKFHPAFQAQSRLIVAWAAKWWRWAWGA
jgi:hypothetical protein